MRNVDNQLVSIIVPVFNAEPYLAQCLDSILAQTHRELEVICLNDGSTDGSLAIMQAYAARDERIRVIDKQNQGYGATCNRGLEEARGAWISIVEPDDWIEPGMYADMLAFEATFNDPADIVKTPYWRIWMPDTPEQLPPSHQAALPAVHHPRRGASAHAPSVHMVGHLPQRIP